MAARLVAEDGGMTLDAKNQAYLWRFLLGLLITEIPIVTIELSKPEPDWRLLAIGLLGGLGAYLEKRVSPQLSTPGVETSPRG
jgi:hypothetical protein